MKNIWTQHLERSSPEERDKETTFTRMLHSLVKAEAEDSGSVESTLLLSENMISEEPSYSYEENGNVDTDIQNEQPVLLGNEGIDASFASETVVTSWAAESQKNHELGSQFFEKDYVKLLMTEGGRLFLRYEVAGENPFEMKVDSEDEATEIIDEDNSTTEQLYPDNPELKWIKISVI